MIKKYSLLTILVVIILTVFLATETNAQKGRRGSKILGKTSDVTSKKKTGKKSAEIIIENSPKSPKKKRTLQPLELEPAPEQTSRWELTGEIKVTGTETYPHYNGSCTKTIDRTYKSKVILDYMQQGFPTVTDPNDVAKIALTLPNTMSVGNSRTMWMVSPLRAASSSENVHIKITDSNKCSWKASYGKPAESEDLWIFNDYLPSVDSANTVSLDKGQKTIYIGLQFFGSGKTVRHIITMTGQDLIEEKGSIPPSPIIEGVTTNVKLPATAAFLMNPNSGFNETFPTQDGNHVIAEKIKESVTVTYTFKKL